MIRGRQSRVLVPTAVAMAAVSLLIWTAQPRFDSRFVGTWRWSVTRNGYPQNPGSAEYVADLTILSDGMGTATFSEGVSSERAFRRAGPGQIEIRPNLHGRRSLTRQIGSAFPQLRIVTGTNRDLWNIREISNERIVLANAATSGWYMVLERM